MPRFIRAVSFVTIATVIGTSYYYYAVKRPLYKESEWYRVSTQTSGIINRKLELPVESADTSMQEYVVRSNKETMKDIWNEQIRSAVGWIYSWSH
ncbi:Mic12p Ecym_2333 [Eremothecium cymbalariae DBVPG|uniref:MICOS complex subunit MIC12 n=1 Tax=Eremothecium cymbalariae (strain CBS 270.75 / DBVPG 7215 / KCTC 17166 / NRRL Y-17582) TaxID=931890 RepID=G8JQ70_ERECY|nr:Hypothetical protein Ecym_2333 [Eremothecium cymbalariae DBVPG\